MSQKVLMKGNEAFAEAAIRGGCRYYYGYPITPQNEIPEYMSRELHKHGGAFVQVESEIAAINMAYGTAAAGGRVFITSSSPGIALMQESVSYIASTECPLVFLNVSRCGPGVGGIQPGQADYFQATRGGGNGDYRVPVFAPSNLQESVDIVYEAMDLADYWRTPIMILADGLLAQMMEPVLLPEMRPAIENKDIKNLKPWAVTGYGDDDSNRTVVKSLRMIPEEQEKHVESLFEKFDRAEKELLRVESFDIEDSEIVFASYGSSARITKEAIELLKAQNIKAGLIRPISLWPFPYSEFDKITDKTKVVISVEMSKGQMIQDVKLGVGKRFPVELIYRTGGMIPTALEVAEKAKKILSEISSAPKRV